LPNTLIHIAVQAPISRAFFPKIGIPWILAGTLIPDIPWILQRVLTTWQLADPYQVRLYVTIQASLVFCLLLSLAISSLHRKPIALFLLLAANSLMHLLLDALQIKWGNGVHLVAPLNWQTTHLGLIWPEHIIGYTITLLGVVYLAVKLQTILREGISLRQPPHWKTAVISLVLYFLLPFMFMNQLQHSNTNYLQTLKDTETRAGKEIELDRAFYSKEKGTVTAFTGEALSVAGSLPEESGTISLKGEFVDPQTIRSMDFHKHNHYRDTASKVGIFLTLAIWLSLLLKSRYNLIRLNWTRTKNRSSYKS